jgi:hypothetical protein
MAGKKLVDITARECRADAEAFVHRAVKKHGLDAEGWEIESAIRNVAAVFLRLALAQSARRPNRDAR